MALKKFGTLSEATLATLQPGSKVVEKDDGHLEGSAQFVVDISKEALIPDIGSTHPRDSRAILFRVDRTYGVASKITANCSYIGITENPTPPVASYSGGSNQQPIETHPRFKEHAGDVTVQVMTEAGYVTPILRQEYKISGQDGKIFEIEGTSSQIDAFLSANSGATKTDEDARATGIGFGRNGAKFDTNTGKFIEFSDPNNIKSGMSAYLEAGDIITVTYWTTDDPDFSRKDKVFSAFPHSSVKVDPDVVSWYCMDTPIKQVGTLSLYQVTEIFLGSSKSEGWDLDWYQEFGGSIPVRSSAITL